MADNVRLSERFQIARTLVSRAFPTWSHDRDSRLLFFRLFKFFWTSRSTSIRDFLKSLFIEINMRRISKVNKKTCARSHWWRRSFRYHHQRLDVTLNRVLLSGIWDTLFHFNLHAKIWKKKKFFRWLFLFHRTTILSPFFRLFDNFTAAPIFAASGIWKLYTKFRRQSSAKHFVRMLIRKYCATLRAASSLAKTKEFDFTWFVFF